MKCLLCGSENTGVVWKCSASDLIEQWKTTFGIDIVEDLTGHSEIALHVCRSCGFSFFDPTLALHEATYSILQEIPWYYLEDKWEYDQALRDLRGISTLVELGCGRGVFVEKAQRLLGVRAIGLDSNVTAVVNGQTCGLNITAMSARDFAQSHRSEFDAVCLFQVLEHVPDPLEFMAVAVSMVRPGGRIVLSVPNAESYLRAGGNLLDMAPHHITKWDRNTLQKLAEMCGISCIRFREEPLSTHQVHGFADS